MRDIYERLGSQVLRQFNIPISDRLEPLDMLKFDCFCHMETSTLITRYYPLNTVFTFIVYSK